MCVKGSRGVSGKGTVLCSGPLALLGHDLSCLAVKFDFFLINIYYLYSKRSRGVSGKGTVLRTGPLTLLGHDPNVF